MFGMAPHHPQLTRILQHVAIRDPRGKLLVLEPQPDLFALPGGALHLGEDWHPSLARLLKDQTGIVQFKLTDILEVDSWAEHGETFYSILFGCDVPEFERMILAKEKLAHAWVTVEHAIAGRFDHERTKERVVRLLAQAPYPYYGA
jgi:ADP-ribose pyrophosphatase YjhB (NUDIX family)